MSNEQETIADIAAWIRDVARSYRNTPISKGITIEGLRVCDALEGIADRIEAAAKRECSTQNPENCVVGNSAAMREALEKIGAMETPHNFQIERSDIVDACYDLTKAIKIAKAALSEPPLPCDTMDWHTAWAKWRAENHPQKPVSYSECYESTTRFMDWYMGTAEDRGTTLRGEEGGKE